MNEPVGPMALATDGTLDCNECATVGETPRGEVCVTVRIGKHYSGLCLAHAIQLSLHIRREVRKQYPAALKH